MPIFIIDSPGELLAPTPGIGSTTYGLGNRFHDDRGTSSRPLEASTLLTPVSWLIAVMSPAIGDDFGCHHHWEMGIGTGQHRED